MTYLNIGPSPTRRQLSRRPSGVTLVEILVTVVIMSVGLLGIAALHTYTLRGNQDALIRLQATSLTQDIVDRMRGNRDQAKAGLYDTALATTYSAPSGATIISQRDLYYWKTLVAGALPSGQCSIVRTVNLGGAGSDRWLFTITITWGDRATDEGQNTSSQFVTVVEV